MSYRRLLVMMVAMVVGGGCGNACDSVTSIDAAEFDADVDAPDADVDAPDADVDAPVDAPDAAATSSVDLTSAGGRMQGGTLTLDFAIGHSSDQARATGGTLTLEGAATLPP